MERSVFLLYVVFVPLGLCQIDEYHFVNKNLNWTDAQQYCREHFTDLATVESADDLNRMNVPAGVQVWIGLYDDPAAWFKVMASEPNSWRWSSTGTTSPGGYQNWHKTQPNYSGANDSCGCISKKGWNDYICENKLKAMCYKVQSNTKQFILANAPMSWAESVDYCREQYTDLAMIESLAENTAVFSKLEDDASAWSGLYRNPWLWSDNSNSSFRHWGEGEPNNIDNSEHCVSMGSGLTWFDDKCERQLPFICYETLPRHSAKLIKVEFQSTADLSDPFINSQILNMLREELKMNVTILNLKKTPATKQKP